MTMSRLHCTGLVGQMVQRKDGQMLRSGCSVYDHAVVICADPFAIASVRGDMLWTHTVDRDQFDFLGRAPDVVLQAAMRRLPDVGLPNAKADLAPASGAQVQRLVGPALGAK